MTQRTPDVSGPAPERGPFAVVVAAGSLRDDAAVRFPHRWTAGGVSVEADFTGAHLMHLSVAGCVLNDLYREAPAVAVRLDGVRVTASGGLDTSSWTSTGIEYVVEIDSSSSADRVARLLAVVDDVAEIPRVLRAGPPVRRAT